MEERDLLPGAPGGWSGQGELAGRARAAAVAGDAGDRGGGGAFEMRNGPPERSGGPGRGLRGGDPHRQGRVTGGSRSRCRSGASYLVETDGPEGARKNISGRSGARCSREGSPGRARTGGGDVADVPPRESRRRVPTRSRRSTRGSIPGGTGRESPRGTGGDRETCTCTRAFSGDERLIGERCWRGRRRTRRRPREVHGTGSETPYGGCSDDAYGGPGGGGLPRGPSRTPMGRLFRGTETYREGDRRVVLGRARGAGTGMPSGSTGRREVHALPVRARRRRTCTSRRTGASRGCDQPPWLPLSLPRGGPGRRDRGRDDRPEALQATG